MNHWELESAIRDALAADRRARRAERDQGIADMIAVLRVLAVIAAVIAGFIFAPAATAVILVALVALRLLYVALRGTFRAVGRGIGHIAGGVRSWTGLSWEARGARLYGVLKRIPRYVVARIGRAWRQHPWSLIGWGVWGLTLLVAQVCMHY